MFGLNPGKGGSIGGAVASAISYLLRATFTASDQSFTNGQVLGASEGVEDGSLTVVDTGAGAVSISSNECVASGANSFSSSGLLGAGVSRALGVVYIGTLNAPSNAIIFAFDDTQALSASATHNYSCYFKSDSKITIKLEGTSLMLGDWTFSEDVSFGLVLGGYSSDGSPYKAGDTKSNFTYGCSFFVKNTSDYAGNWNLIYKDDSLNAATVYPLFSTYSAGVNTTVKNLAVPDADLSALLEPTNLSTSVSTTNTFAHISDCLIECKVTILPSSGNLDIEFRRQDDSNKWICRVTSAGAISLVEVVAASETTRIGPVSSAVSNGDRVVIIADDDDISLFSADTARGSYASATNFSNDTGGKIVFGSGAIAHIADWARGTNGEYVDLDTY